MKLIWKLGLLCLKQVIWTMNTKRQIKGRSLNSKTLSHWKPEGASDVFKGRMGCKYLSSICKKASLNLYIWEAAQLSTTLTQSTGCQPDKVTIRHNEVKGQDRNLLLCLYISHWWFPSCLRSLGMRSSRCFNGSLFHAHRGWETLNSLQL